MNARVKKPLDYTISAIEESYGLKFERVEDEAGNGKMITSIGITKNPHLQADGEICHEFASMLKDEGIEYEFTILEKLAADSTASPGDYPLDVSFQIDVTQTRFKGFGDNMQKEALKQLNISLQDCASPEVLAKTNPQRPDGGRDGSGITS